MSTTPSQQAVSLGPLSDASRGHGAAGAVVDRAAFVQPAAYWYTIKDCQRLLLRSRATVFRYLHLVPPQDRVMVKRFITHRRITQYWRISPAGLRVLGHATGQAPYL